MPFGVDTGAGGGGPSPEEFSAAAFGALGEKAHALYTAGAGGRLDLTDVAIAADADGVHVGDDDMPLEDARRIIGPLKILGASVKNRDQALQAQREGADYVGAGACYTTSTKSDSVLVGLEAVREIKEAVSIPVVAIGGINEKNAAEVLALTGADGVAVVSAVFGGPDVEESSRRMREVLSKVY